MGDTATRAIHRGQHRVEGKREGTGQVRDMGEDSECAGHAQENCSVSRLALDGAPTSCPADLP